MLLRGSARIRAASALGFLLVLGSMPAIAHAKTSRADLLISAGAAAQANDTLNGSFSVRNSGSARAKSSSAVLTVKVSGEDRVLKRFTVAKLSRAASAKVKISFKIPSDLPTGTFSLRICADANKKVAERTERNNCRRIGTLKIVDKPSSSDTSSLSGTPTSGQSESPSQGSTSTPNANKAAEPTDPISSVPTDPIAFTKETVFTLNSPQSNYWVFVPSSYDESHNTPISLLVWLHGCGGMGASDIYTVSPGGDDKHYISIAVGGREGGCWDVNSDSAKVLAAIANLKTHFNINPRRVVLGGYSSGGDLSYRTAFYNANEFAGVLAENTTPFRDTGSSQSASIAAASWKFNIVHLAHTEDDTYQIAVVRNETDALLAAGFPITRIERPGGHYDPDMGNTGTDYDLVTYLLPHMDDPWLAP